MIILREVLRIILPVLFLYWNSNIIKWLRVLWSEECFEQSPLTIVLNERFSESDECHPQCITRCFSILGDRLTVRCWVSKKQVGCRLLFGFGILSLSRLYKQTPKQGILHLLYYLTDDKLLKYDWSFEKKRQIRKKRKVFRSSLLITTTLFDLRDKNSWLPSMMVGYTLFHLNTLYIRWPNLSEEQLPPDVSYEK